MPNARSKVTIEAPYELVLELLIDKVERPKKYVGTIQHSRVLERGDGYIIREMVEPAPTNLVIRERIYRQPTQDGETFVYEHMNNAKYTGAFHNLLTRVDGRPDRCALEYVMDWVPHPGTDDPIAQDQADRMVALGVGHMRELAEHPPQVPAIVTRFYQAIDSLDADALAPLIAENIRFRFGSHSDVLGRARVVELHRMIMASWSAIRHDFVSVHEAGDKIFVECFADYTLPDGSDYLLPFMSVFEHNGALVTNLKVFGDASPLHHGWPVAG